MRNRSNEGNYVNLKDNNLKQWGYFHRSSPTAFHTDLRYH